MDKQIYYHGSDGHIKQLGDQELQHWKYIKKIGNRYFYTPEELRAYYAEAKDSANREAAFKERDRADTRDMRLRMSERRHEKSRNIYKNGVYLVDDGKGGNLRNATKQERREAIRKENKEQKKDRKQIERYYKADKRKLSAIKNVKPIIETGKMALLGKKKPKATQPKHSQSDIDRIKRESQAREIKRREALKKKKKKEAAHKQYSPASRW